MAIFSSRRIPAGSVSGQNEARCRCPWQSRHCKKASGPRQPTLKPSMDSPSQAAAPRPALATPPPVVPVAGLRSSITGVSVGILGHLAWDLLTHRCSDGIAFLEVPAFAGLPLYQILQHASSLVGLGFCLASMRGWLRVQASGFQRSLARLLAWVQVVALPAGFLNGSLAETYRERAGRFATAWLAGMVVALVACVLLRAWRSARSGESGRWPSREPQQRAAAQVRPRDGACGDGAGTRRRIRP